MVLFPLTENGQGARVKPDKHNMEHCNLAKYDQTNTQEIFLDTYLLFASQSQGKTLSASRRASGTASETASTLQWSLR